MSNAKIIRSKIHQRFLTLDKELIQEIGLTETVVMTEILDSIEVHNKNTVVINNEKWFVKSYDDWKKEFRITNYTIKQVIKNLENLGLIETKLMKFEGVPTIHYKIL